MPIGLIALGFLRENLMLAERSEAEKRTEKNAERSEARRSDESDERKKCRRSEACPDGDLAQPLEPQLVGEIGQIADGVRRMASRTARTLATLSSVRLARRRATPSRPHSVPLSTLRSSMARRRPAGSAANSGDSMTSRRTHGQVLRGHLRLCQ